MATTSKNRLNITELDFEQIRGNLKNFLEAQTQFQDYDFDGSGLSTLIDVLAYNTYYNAFNANMHANELYLDTAQVRNNVVAHAKLLGYVPRSRSSAFANIDVVVNSPAGSPTFLTMDRGTTFTSKIGNSTYTFVNLEAQTISPVGGVYRFENVQINQGTLKSSRYVVDDPVHQHYTIPYVNVDVSSMVVKVRPNYTSTEESIYVLGTNIVNVDGTSQVYFLQEGLDGKYQIYFGDNIFGKELEQGNIVTIEYIVSDGPDANGASLFTMTGNIEGNTNVTIYLNSRAGGGALREDVESIKYNAPLSFLSQNRVVTADDYVTVIKNSYADAETVAAWGGEENDPPDYGKVYISIKPRSAETLTIVQKQFIIDNILKTKNLVSITPEIIDPAYTYLSLDVFFKYDPNLTALTAGELKAKVSQVISDYNDNFLKKFDGVFRHSNLMGLIDNCDPSILNTTIRVYMQKRFVPNIGTAQKYEIEFSAPLYASTSNERVIDSTGFTLNGVTQYIKDAQTDTPSVIHPLQIYRLSGSNEIVTVSDAGYIDPLNGLVVLTAFNPESYEGSYITINASPNSNDIAPKRNQLLQIDMTQVTVEPQIDTIATGGVVAGIGYVTVPRHAD